MRPSCKRLIVAAALAVVFVAFTTATLLADLTPNVSSYWKLDEASGNRANSVTAGALSDSTPAVSVQAGILGNSIGSDYHGGAGQMLSESSSAATVLNGTDWTINFWAYLPDATDTNNHGLVTKLTGSDEEYDVYYDGTANRFKANISGGAGFSNRDTVTASTFGAINSTTWYMVTVKHVNGATICIAVNAGTCDSVAHTTGTYSGTATFKLLGGDYMGNVYARVDEVSISKRAFSGSEITALFNSNVGITYEDWPTNPPASATKCQRMLMGMGC